MSRALRVVGSTLALLCLLLGPLPVAAADSDDVRLTPVVGLVRGADSDPAAEQVVRSALTSAGVRRIVLTDGHRPPTHVTVWLGDGDAALADLGVENADGLAAEGFVLAAGGEDIVLDGVDADGTFYAAHQLRKLIEPRNGRPHVRAATIREEPRMRYRGLIEGFYGTPWTQNERLGLLDYLGSHRMNTFEYAPKDDPYHRELWREPYPADKLAQLGALVDRAIANHVDFTFALSPGLSICYTLEADRQAVLAKFESLYELGVRAFNVPLDDIDYSTWHCDADRERYGTGGGAAGRAQSELLNVVQQWVAAKGDVAPLQMVPTEYYNVAESPYKKALRDLLDPDVVVHWTGTAVIPHDITRAQAAQARAVFGHPILVWDNYPVNDYIAGRIPLAPYTGREAGLSNEVAGVISNPMNQPVLSTIALYSFGEYGWDDVSYDATASWERALAERAGGDPEVIAALRTFADLNWYEGTLHLDRAPRLAADVGAFWSAWNAGRRAEAVAGLRPVVHALVAAPDVLRGALPADFVAEADVWLSAAKLWAEAMEAGLDGLAASDPSAAWTQRQLASGFVKQARALRDTRLPHANVAPLIGDGVVDTFVAESARRFDAAVGVGVDRAVATTSMGTYADNVPARMLDGNLDTFYWTDNAPQTGDAIGVDLGRARPIGAIAVLMGKSGSTSDFIGSGVLEYSANGTAWTELARGTTAEVRATPPAGTTARYVRYRALANNDPYWLVVREFAVDVLDATRLTVSGTPLPAAGSALRSAADDDLDTSYVAATAPVAGDALVVTLSAARQLDRVTVLQETGAAGTGEVSVRRAGEWVPIGALGGTFTELAAGGEADAIRIVWVAGAPAPRVSEFIPRYAG